MILHFLFQDLKDRVSLHKKDVQNLLSVATELAEGDERIEGPRLQDLSARFERLENLVEEKHDHYTRLLHRWKSFIDRKKRFKDVLRSTTSLRAMRSTCSSKKDLEKNLVCFQVRKLHLHCMIR